VTPYADPVLDFALSAHHYRLTGIEMRPNSRLYVFELIRIGSFATQLSQLPRDIIVDQCTSMGIRASRASEAFR
jgi:hypothetical protein